MLTFKKTNILFGTVLVILLCTDFFRSIPWTVFILLLAAYLGLLFYGSYSVRSNFYMPVICKASAEMKMVAISFDDGPAESYTTEILDSLDEAGVKAAFFCIGKNIAGREALVRRIHAGGHLIGNHSYSHHALFDFFPAAKMLKDILAMDEEVKKILGTTPRLFRPPYGVTNPNLNKAIRSSGHTAIGWSIRSLDTITKDEKKILRRVTGTLHPGDIILFHDTSRTTLSVLPECIRRIREQGFQITRLDNLLNLDAYA